MCHAVLPLREIADIVDKATEAVSTRKRQIRLNAIKSHQIKSTAVLERDLRLNLIPFVKRQVADIAKRLRGMTARSVAPIIKQNTTDDAAKSIMATIFDAKEWLPDLIDSTLPPIAVGMVRMARDQLSEMGVKRFKATLLRPEGTKRTTASDWLQQHPEDAEKLQTVLSESGLSIAELSELPVSMRKVILARLTDSFKQPYWENIAATTGGDAEKFLARGLKEGWSIRKISTNIATSLGGDTDKYAKVRATNIARTESGNSLNAARKASMEQVQADVGPQVPMRPTWLSVLSDTTRDTHANNDGVPADEDGMWELSGYIIPWPAHYSLPAEERCSCMCTTYADFGMDDAEAQQIIGDHYEGE